MNILTRTKSGALTLKPSSSYPDRPIVLTANRCANCDQEFSSTRQCARKFLMTRAGARNTDVGKNKSGTSSTVDICDALQEIIEWRFGKENCGELEIHRSAALCSMCCLTLAKLYGAIKSFEELGVSLSYIGLITQKLLNGFKIQTESQAEPKSKSKTLRHRRRRSSGSSTSNSNSDEDMEDPVDACGDPDSDYAPSDAEDIQPPVTGRSKKSKPVPGEPEPVIAPPRPIPEEIRVDDTEEKDAQDRATKDNLCYICGAGFDKPTNLRRHLLLTHEIGDRARDFVCNICERAYHFAYLLKNHMISHSDARTVSCPTPGCDMKFKSSHCLYNHVKQVHRGERPFSCRFCPKRFKVKREKRVHEAYIHITPKGSREFDCPYGCGASYKRKRSMLAHSRHNCLKRPFGQGSEDEVDEAVESITGDGTEAEKVPRLRKPRAKPTFTCVLECGQIFKSKSSLLSHQRNRCKIYVENKKKAGESSLSNQAGTQVGEPIPSASVVSEYDNHLIADAVIEEPCDLMNIIDQME